ncbi:glutamine amidotransferase [Rhizobium sp.]|uniref:glutamine amidotransferase n=1 Tax=Rhizobium sp. TaxID=391 RepID=UPI00289910ED
MSKTALVLRHVQFEDLGHFRPPLEYAGYEVAYSDLTDGNFCRSDPLEPDLMVILGGPVGVYENDIYPFLDREVEFIRARVEAGRPTLGVCLGAQLIAASLGAPVFPSGIKEIGFSKLRISAEGLKGPLRHLDGIEVLHWHGDTYRLPKGAVNLASTDLIEQQAYALGHNILGLQFHPEAETGPTFERWLVGHAAELSAAKIDVPSLRAQGIEHALKLRAASISLLSGWLAGLEEP